MHFRFGLKRLLTAVAAFCWPLALFGSYGWKGLLIALVVGIAQTIVVLTIRQNRIWPAIRLGLFVYVGAQIGMLFCPMTHPPYDPGDELSYLLIGGFVGSVLAKWYAHDIERSTRVSITKPK